MTTPYTYLLKHIPTNKLYYGVRYAKDCDPSEFWITYKTSSKYVKNLIEQYGSDSFIFEIRKTFDNDIKAREWESKVLKRLDVVNRKDFINQTDNISISREAAAKGRETQRKNGPQKMPEHQRQAIIKANTGLKRTPEVKEKMSQALKGRQPWNKGVAHSEETKEKMRQARIGKSRNASFKTKMSKQMSGRKMYINHDGIRKLFHPGTETTGFYPNNTAVKGD